MDAMQIAEDTPVDKITILPGATADLSGATYCILEEDHTLGNLLRWMIMKNPAVEFCGYSAPHPSEAKIHIRIQTYDNVSSLVVLHEALDNLESMTTSIQDAYVASLTERDFDEPTEETYDFESVNRRLWETKEAEGRGSREEFEAAKREKAREAEEKMKSLSGSKLGGAGSKLKSTGKSKR